jgi:hypothetical protein
VDQSIVDAAETARLDDNPETQTYLTAVDSEENQPTPNYEPVTLDYNSSAQFANTNNTVGAYPEIRGDDETIAFEPEPTYVAPAPGPVFYDYTSGGDSGSSDSGYQGDDSDQEQSDGGRGSRYAVGGIVRLRKNKQNTRIHDRRKRLAMGGITSLHG